MKNMKMLAVFIMTFVVTAGYSQENWISASGGYAFSSLKDHDTNATGWRASLSYEKNAFEGKMANGFVVGYISTAATVDAGLDKTEYQLNNWPIYYMPKYLIGGGAFKFYLKGAVGMHIFNYKETETILIIEDTVVGFYGGLGAGAMMSLGSIYINADYEWAFASNSVYINGYINSATVGLGVKF